MKREVSTPKELGSFVHDARTKLGLTQEALAQRAGVSRKWLIGLEQGARSRAELGKVFDTFEALGISINLSFITHQQNETEVQDALLSLANISPATLEAMKKVSSESAKPLQQLTRGFDAQPAQRSVIKDVNGQSAVQKMMKDMSGQSAVQKMMKDMSGQSAVQKMMKDMSGQSAVQKMMKDISGPSALQNMIKELSDQPLVQGPVQKGMTRSTLSSQVHGRADENETADNDNHTADDPDDDHKLDRSNKDDMP